MKTFKIKMRSVPTSEELCDAIRGKILGVYVTKQRATITTEKDGERIACFLDFKNGEGLQFNKLKKFLEDGYYNISSIHFAYMFPMNRKVTDEPEIIFNREFVSFLLYINLLDTPIDTKCFYMVSKGPISLTKNKVNEA